jgi:Protein of unknown function (DUF2934)
MKETRKPAGGPRTPGVARPAARAVPAKGKAAARKNTVTVPAGAKRPLRGEDREERVRVAAYFRAQRRGFLPGYELEDWLAAEAEVSAARARSSTRSIRMRST